MRAVRQPPAAGESLASRHVTAAHVSRVTRHDISDQLSAQLGHTKHLPRISDGQLSSSFYFFWLRPEAFFPKIFETIRNIFIIVCHNSVALAVKPIEDQWHISAQQVDAFSI